MPDPLFDDATLPPDLQSRVDAEVRDGERLLWVGQPRPGRMARQALPIVLFGIPWTAFAVFWVAAASGMMFAAGGNNGPGGGFGGVFNCFPLFGIPFVLIGLFMLTSPFWMYLRAKKTFYAITDRRAVVWAAGHFGSVEVRSYGPSALGRIRRTEYADGGGDLVFEEEVTYGTRGRRNVTRHGFIAVDRVRVVEELVRRALLDADRADRPD